MKKLSLWMIAAGCFMALASAAYARSAYDGSWDLVFVTQRGACDASYNFTVNVSDGNVSHPKSSEIQRTRGKIRRGSRVGHGS